MSSEEEGPVAWLRAQVEARKAAAEAATPGPWVFEGDDPTDDELYTIFDTGPDHLFAQTVAFTRHRQVANGQHMAWNDPRDAIARCEAELGIIEAHDRPKHYCPLPVLPGIHSQLWTPEEGPCWTLRLLLSAYRHRPGYCEDDWKPGVSPWKAPR
jgi:Family of unknown function (DUF6221)